MYLANGDCYKGNFTNGKSNGFGEYFYFFGDKYSGMWDGGIRSGKGLLTYHNGAKYEGTWKADKADDTTGTAQFIFFNGEK